MSMRMNINVNLTVLADPADMAQLADVRIRTRWMWRTGMLCVEINNQIHLRGNILGILVTISIVRYRKCNKRILMNNRPNERSA